MHRVDVDVYCEVAGSLDIRWPLLVDVEDAEVCCLEDTLLPLVGEDRCAGFVVVSGCYVPGPTRCGCGCVGRPRGTVDRGPDHDADFGLVVENLLRFFVDRARCA